MGEGDGTAVAAGVAGAALLAASWCAMQWCRTVLADRAAYHRMPPTERELVVRAILFALHNGCRSSRGVAERLDLRVFTVDEALRRLARHGYVQVSGGGRVAGTVRVAGLTRNGRRFYDAYFGRPGQVFTVAPWGTVVHSSAVTVPWAGDPLTPYEAVDTAPVPVLPVPSVGEAPGVRVVTS